jgi:hypothetical protein
MSEPPLNGYGAYDYSSTNQNAQPSYSPSRQPGNSSYGQQYQSDDRQHQYAQPGYDSRGQNHPSYGSNSQPQYPNNSWKKANSQGGQYDYRREGSNDATQAAAGNATQGFYDNNPSNHAVQSLQALNSLAYASGLDNQRQSSSRTQQQTQSSSRVSAAPMPAAIRVRSPMQAVQQQQYTGVHSAGYGSQQGASNSTTSPQLAISAAQALAGAVSRRYRQGGDGQKTTSPAMSSIPAVYSVQRTSSPYSAPSRPQSHARRSSAQAQSDQVASPNIAYQQTPSHAPGKGSHHTLTSSQTRRSAASQSNSISNLVSTMQEPHNTGTMAAEAMPTYIDPTQVFNPYHKEHERRRKEAAEAESRCKQQEAAAAAAGAQPAAEQTLQDEEAAKLAKEKQKGDEAPLKAISPDEDEMALGMRMMIEKMKEFRSKDPSLFQKLWDDMRKGGSGGSASATSNSAPAPASTSPQLTPQNSTPQATSQSTSSTPKPAAARNRGSKSQQRPSAASQLPGAPQANGWRVVVEENEEGLPDLGRYPAERHMRSSYHKAKPTPATQVPGPSTGSSAASVTKEPVPKQPLPAKSASGGVEWPRDKRDSLAAAAIQALKSNPENEKVVLSPTDIHAMLEQNPSYVQLCDLLEKKGLKFHRGQFARQLLSTVPDLTTPQKSKELPQSRPTTTVPPPPVQQQTPPMVSHPTQRSPHLSSGPPSDSFGHPPPPPIPANGFVGAFPPPSGPPTVLMGHLPPFPPNQFVMAQRHSMNFQHVPYQTGPYGYIPTAVKPEHKALLGPKPPQTKVKKSTMPTRPEPPPGSKEAMARKRDFAELVDLTRLSDNDDYVLSSKHPRVESPSPEPNPFVAFLQQQSHQSSTRQPAHMPLHSIGLPAGAPLKFDPSRDAQVPAMLAPSPAPKPRTILARPVNKHEALRKSYYDPKTVARDVLIAAGRHPSERPLNAHMAGLLGVHIDLDSDLSTFDWDAIDPGGPPAPKVEYVEIPAGPPRFKLGGQAGTHGPRPRLSPGSRHPDSDKRQKQDSAPAPPPFVGQKMTLNHDKRGVRSSNDELFEQGNWRPSKLRESRAVDDESPAPPRSVTPRIRQVTVVSESSPRDRPRRSSSLQQPQSSSPNMDVESVASGVFYPSGKRRGRPPGSKNNHVALGQMKKDALPPQPLIEIPARTSSPMGIPVYKCKWRRCHAELHNLATLRRHVSRVHQPTEAELADHGYGCWWKKCQYQTNTGEEILLNHQFENASAWMAHIEHDHLHPIAMKLGDGPSTQNGT